MKSEIIQKLEERELAYRNRLTFFEQELALRKKGCEVNRRKAVENAQITANLKKQIGENTFIENDKFFKAIKCHLIAIELFFRQISEIGEGNATT